MNGGRESDGDALNMVEPKRPGSLTNEWGRLKIGGPPKWVVFLWFPLNATPKKKYPPKKTDPNDSVDPDE